MHSVSKKRDTNKIIIIVQKLFFRSFYDGNVISQWVLKSIISVHSIALQGYAAIITRLKEKKISSVTLYVCIYIYIQILVGMYVGGYIKSYSHLYFID